MFILFCLLIIIDIVMFIYLFQKILDLEKDIDMFYDYYEKDYMSIKKEIVKNGM